MEGYSFDSLNFGWHPSPEEVKRIVEENNILNISQCLGTISDKEKPETVNFIPYMEKAFGPRWWRNQGTCGSCVAAGAAAAVDVLAAIDYVNNGTEKPKHADICSIYWGSRVEIGGGRIWGQGSVGVWAAQWLQKYGMIPMDKYPSIDLSTYSASVCCGSNARKGCPDELEPIARKHPVKTYAQVSNFDDMTDAIASGYPVTIASDQGFSQNRDSDGFASPRGTWQHQMCIIGYRLDKPGALILNSWDEYFSGGGNLCRACFWAGRDTVSRMLRQGDSWALSDLVGWPRKSLDFTGLKF